MYLNADCVRDSMFCLADNLMVENTSYGLHFKSISLNAVAARLIKQNNYSYEEVAYTVLQLAESGYIKATVSIDDKTKIFYISDILYITPSGHELLATIKNDNIWGKTKSVLKDMGGVSLAIINSIAQGFAQGLAQELTVKMFPLLGGKS